MKSRSSPMVVFLLMASACLGACGGGSDAGGVTLIDQQSTDVGDILLHPQDGVEWSQTFQVGITGVLTRIDLRMISPPNVGTVFLDIRDVTTTGPPIEDDDQALVVTSIPVSAVAGPGDWTRFSIGGNLRVNAGRRLAIVVRSQGIDGTLTWEGAATDPYALGGVYWRSPGDGVTAWSLSPDTNADLFDAAFRVLVRVD